VPEGHGFAVQKAATASSVASRMLRWRSGATSVRVAERITVKTELCE